MRDLLTYMLLIGPMFLFAANSAPTDISITSSSVNENESIGTLIGNLSSTDVDPDVHTYSLVAGVGDTDNALFNIAGDQLETNAVFDFETQNSYAIRVQTDDGNGGVYSESFIITILNVNENPVVNDDSFTIAENLANGTVVGTVTSSDIDGDGVTYSIIAGNTGTAFSIGAGSGIITINNSSSVDFESTPIFTLTVQGLDDGAPNLSDNATITINLTNVNDAPIINQPGVQSVNEDTDLTIAGLSISDQDVATDSLDVCLSVTQGVISLSSISGLNFSSGDGADDASMCFRGTLADVNTAINNLVYHSNENYVGVDALSISVDDLGNNGPGGNLTDASTLTINVNAIGITFTTQPTGATICEEEANLFYIAHNADPTDPVTYQWQKNGVNIVGATNDSLWVNNAALGDAGTYRCRVSNPAGTFNSNNAVLVVNAKPVSDFSYSQACLGETTNFTNASSISSGTIVAYNWDFTDGNTSTDTDPSNDFPASGYYEVFLESVSNLGCKDTLIDSVLVDYFPDLGAVIEDVCFESSFEPVNNTTIVLGTMTHSWTFGDGSSSNQMNPSYDYSSTGTYTVTYSATSDQGCRSTVVKVIDVNPKPNANFVVNDGCDSTLIPINGVSSISSGSINYFYAFGDGDSAEYVMNPQHLFDGAGTYNIELIVVSDQSCTDTIQKEVEIYPNPYLDVQVLNPGCGSVIGTLIAAADSSTDPYFFSFEYNAFTFEDTAYYVPGIYSVRAKDFNGCITERLVEIEAPEYVGLADLETVNANCHDLDNGSAYIEASGGDGDYIYTCYQEVNQNLAFVGSNPYGEFHNLGPGVYEVQVFNADICASSFYFGITEPDSIQIDIDATHILCKGDSLGEISFSASGGTAPFEYSINDGQDFSTTTMFDSLSAGYYLVQIRDANNCATSFGVNLEEPAFALDLNVTSQTNVKCTGLSTGSIMVNGSGGKGSYSYSTDGLSFSSGNVLQSLSAGSGMIYVKDENGCLDSLTFEITEPAESLVLSVNNVEDVLCNGGNNGEISIDVNGGTGNYTYYLNGSLVTLPLDNLEAYDYELVVKDQNNCRDTSMVEVVEPDALDLVNNIVTNESCEGDQSATSNFLVQGGASPYTYYLDGQSNNDGLFDNLTTGSFELVVSDNNGCEISELVEINPDNYLPRSQFSFFNANGAISTDNQSQYGNSYKWFFGDGTTSTEFEPIHIYNSFGAYKIRLVSYNDCGTDTLAKMFYYGVSGIDDQAMSHFIYPNPTNGVVIVDLDLQELIDIKVYDLIGNELMISNTFSSNQLNLSELAEGSYFIVARKEDGQVYQQQITLIK